MKHLIAYVCLGLVIFGATSVGFAEGQRIKLYSYAPYPDITYEWWVPLRRLENLPKWYPEREHPPPLSTSKAIQIATKWIVKKEGGKEGGPAGDVVEIVIQPFHPDDTRFRAFWYYRIIFSNRPFNRVACIVLMDGSVLEPEKAKAPRAAESSPTKK